MIIRSVVASTHIDRHNERFSKEALDSAAEQAQVDSSVPFLIDHDYTLPPCGKTLRAWVEPLQDGEHRLVFESEMFDEVWDVRLPDGMLGLAQESRYDKRPFRTRVEATHKLRVAYDPHNFESLERSELFLQGIRQAGDFETREFGRKSLIPDPELLITLTSSVVAGLVGKRVVDRIADKMGDRIAEDVAAFYTLVREAAIGMARYAVPRYRPVTYVFQISGEPAIELVARTSDVATLLAAVSNSSLMPPLSQAQDLRVS